MHEPIRITASNRTDGPRQPRRLRPLALDVLVGAALVVGLMASDSVFAASGPLRRRAQLNRRLARPAQQPQRVPEPQLDDREPPITYSWVETPHWQDGYWVEYTGEQMAEKTGIRGWKGYPFSHYVWEWPGYKLGDKTWCIDTFHGETIPRKKRWELRPNYSPYWPGQKYNL